MSVTEAQRAYQKAYYLANRARVLARVKARHMARRDEVSQYKKRHRAANKARLAAKSKAYYEAHREERIAQQKALHESKPDAVKAYKKQWWDRNREQFAKDRATPQARARSRVTAKKRYDENYQKDRLKFLARNAKRRALKRTAVTGPIDFMQILRDSKGLCGICRKPLDLFGIDFDHIVPLSKGGTHTRANIQATHASCNRSKGAKVG